MFPEGRFLIKKRKQVEKWKTNFSLSNDYLLLKKYDNKIILIPV